MATREANDLVEARKVAKRIYDDWLSDRDFTEKEIVDAITDALRNFAHRDEHPRDSLRASQGTTKEG